MDNGGQLASPAPLPEQKRHGGWKLLRERVLSRVNSNESGGAATPSSEQDVADFLQTSKTNPVKRNWAGGIDFEKAKQFSDDSTKKKLSDTNPIDMPLEAPFKYMKPRRSENLHVDFTAAEPEVIGEGGDESEIPTAQIAGRKRAHTAPSSANARAAPSPRLGRSPTFPAPGSAHGTAPSHDGWNFQEQAYRQPAVSPDPPRPDQRLDREARSSIVGETTIRRKPLSPSPQPPQSPQKAEHMDPHKAPTPPPPTYVDSRKQYIIPPIAAISPIEEPVSPIAPDYDARPTARRKASSPPPRLVPQAAGDETQRDSIVSDDTASISSASDRFGSPRSAMAAAAESLTLAPRFPSPPDSRDEHRPRPFGIEQAAAQPPPPPQLPPPPPSARYEDPTSALAVRMNNQPRVQPPQPPPQRNETNVQNLEDMPSPVRAAPTQATDHRYLAPNHDSEYGQVTPSSGSASPTSTPASSRPGTSDARDRSPSAGTTSPQLTHASAPSLAFDHADVRHDQFGERDQAFEHFLEHISSASGLFRLAVSAEPAPHSKYEWLRACLWWFLRGRHGLEDLVKTPPKTSGSDDPSYRSKEEFMLMQHHMNLAKAWWIISEVLNEQNMASSKIVANTANDLSAAELQQTREILTDNFKRLVLSMARRGLAPRRNSLLPGLDTHIWVGYPEFDQDLRWLLAGRPNQTGRVAAPPPLIALPLGDNASEFCYGRSFSNAMVFTEGGSGTQAFPCVVSVIRKKTDHQISLRISSLTPAVNVTVKTDNDFGPSWEHIRFEAAEAALRIKLPHKKRLRLALRPPDFQFLSTSYEQSRNMQATTVAHPEENHLLSSTLLRLHYTDQRPSRPVFEMDIPNCSASLLEIVDQHNADEEAESLHEGYRIAVVSLPSEKMVRSCSTTIKPNSVTEFESFEKDQTFILRLSLSEPQRMRSLTMAFDSQQQRDTFSAVVTHRATTASESTSEFMSLNDLIIAPYAPAERISTPVTSFPASHVLIVNQTQPQEATLRPQSHAHRRPLARIVVFHNNCALVDRMTTSAEDLKLQLPVDGDAASPVPCIKLLRPPSNDITASLALPNADANLASSLARAASWTTTVPTQQTWTFASLAHMHAFQAAITGYTVLYDGRADSLTISKRIKGVPINKSHDARTPRIQILRDAHAASQQAATTLVFVFFTDYSLANCLAFRISGADIFELESDKGKFTVRFVDAKFSLPSGSEKERKKSAEENGGSGWPEHVSLGSSEYPGEHEDIVFWFKDQASRERFCEALPSKAMKRGFTLKRRL